MEARHAARTPSRRPRRPAVSPPGPGRRGRRHRRAHPPGPEPGRFDFDVTIRSRDTGGGRYADRFDVLAPDDAVLGTRMPLYPHKNEQPCIRDLHGVRIPPGIRRVTVRAHTKGAGHDGATMEVALPGR